MVDQMKTALEEAQANLTFAQSRGQIIGGPLEVG